MSLKVRRPSYSWHPHRLRLTGDQRTLGERSIDGLNAMFGSFKYLIIQTLVVGAWVALNLTAYVRHWDPYPFILLNLAFSLQAAYAAPIILAAGIRTDAKREIVTKETHDHVVESHSKLDRLLYLLGDTDDD